jgi:hypothetical protein
MLVNFIILTLCFGAQKMNTVGPFCLWFKSIDSTNYDGNIQEKIVSVLNLFLSFLKPYNTATIYIALILY